MDLKNKSFCFTVFRNLDAIHCMLISTEKFMSILAPALHTKDINNGEFIMSLNNIGKKAVLVSLHSQISSTDCSSQQNTFEGHPPFSVEANDNLV